MNCPEFDTLMMFLDGELQGNELKAVAEHVLSCSSCRQIVDSQRKLEKSWRDSFVIPDSDQFRRLEQSVFDRINRRSRWKALIPAAAGIIAVLLGVKLIINNQPVPDRLSELSRGIRGEEYTIDDRASIEEQTESFFGQDSDNVADVMDSEPIAISSDVRLSSDEGSGETISEPDIAAVYLEQETQMESVHEEEFIPGSGITTQSNAQESDGQNLASDTEILAGITAGGSGGYYGSAACDESEEYEVPSETSSSIGAAEETGDEMQMDEICEDITLSLDLDTTGLETVQTVSTHSCETEENRSSVQAEEFFSRLNASPAEYRDSTDEGAYVELSFDADGIPDSSTVLLLDSLCAGWNDYIPFYYRDTVLVILLSDVQSLFTGESAATVESMEE